MTEFDRKVEEASARLNRHVANIAASLEKDSASATASGDAAKMKMLADILKK